MRTDSADDYYDSLGIDARADAAQLRRAWRRLARRWHPDRAGDEATATFQKILAAYRILADPLARAEYDSRRVRHARARADRTDDASAAPARPACAGGATACARCGSSRTIQELFSAWLAIRPEAPDSEILVPSALLPGMAGTVLFRIRRRGEPRQL